MATASLSIEKAAAGATSPAVLEFLKSSQKQLLIGGKWVPSKSGKTFETINPANEEVLALIAEGDKADVDEAVAAARRAFDDGRWPALGPHQRARQILRIAETLETHGEELAELETLDNGTPIWMTRAMLAMAAETFRYFSGWPSKIYGETNPSDPAIFNYTLREPVGVCGLIIPWNAPLMLLARKIAPALACGNTVVFKPAEQTPLTAIRFGELLSEVGIPDGVVNIVTGFGPGAGSAIVEHPGVDKVSFTGSPEVGKLILAASAGNLKRVSLELGGKSPNVIFSDANMGAAVPTAMMGFCANSGQICSAGTRIFVQRDCYEEFADRLAAAAGALKSGDPFDSETKLGPLVSQEQFDRVRSYVDIGRNEGAKLALGGQAGFDRGYFFAPTIFTGVENRMKIAREEIFGPVASLIPFKDENDAVLQGNDTVYGLAAAVWTSDLSRAHKIARALKAGTVWINTYGFIDPISPVGGFKQSGIGRELGRHAIDLYTQIKSVYLKL
ncbi:MAG TPA: aldehyde dehydrogenase family protein [Candidatus Binataceae bacterium]|nr:aldehyde dehydrogenase family protein [Candidatus Binataceae bacterium]